MVNPLTFASNPSLRVHVHFFQVSNSKVSNFPMSPFYCPIRCPFYLEAVKITLETRREPEGQDSKTRSQWPEASHVARKPCPALAVAETKP